MADCQSVFFVCVLSKIIFHTDSFQDQGSAKKKKKNVGKPMSDFPNVPLHCIKKAPSFNEPQTA